MWQFFLFMIQVYFQINGKIQYDLWFSNYTFHELVVIIYLRLQVLGSIEEKVGFNNGNTSRGRNDTNT